MNFKTFLKEQEISTIKVWHGGNLEDGFDETMRHKKGRWEHGPGLYLTTHYDTARKYSKGSRKLYQLVIEKGTDLRDVVIDVNKVNEFIDTYLIKNKRNKIKNSLIKYEKNGKYPAYILNNMIINDDAIKGSNTNEFRKFLVENGADYSLIPNAFGWHELMIVLFNTDKIIDKKVITPKDEIDVYDLPNEFN